MSKFNDRMNDKYQKLSKFGKMVFITIYLTISISIGLSLGFTVARTYIFITDKNYYGWPAVTQCSICDETVWVWQKHERREFKVITHVENSTDNIILGGISASGIVHSKCEGTPEINIGVKIK